MTFLARLTAKFLIQQVQSRWHIYGCTIHTLRLHSHFLVRSSMLMISSTWQNLTCHRDYFWATAALYGVSWVTRHIGVTLSRNGLNLKANFEILPDRMLKVTIPTDLDWYPGQHFIIRFLGLGIHALSSHPFTIASRPSSGSMDVYIRVHNGMTKRLLSYGARNKTSRVLVDGPYGGLSQSLRDFEHVLLLSGGSGMYQCFVLLQQYLLITPYFRSQLCHAVTARSRSRV